MTIEIYRKHDVFNSSVIEDYPVAVWNNVSMIEIRGKYIFGNVDGEQLTIKKDTVNYVYIVK